MMRVVEIGGRKTRRRKQDGAGHRRHQDRAVDRPLHRTHATAPVTGDARSMDALYREALRALGTQRFTVGEYAVFVYEAAGLDQGGVVLSRARYANQE